MNYFGRGESLNRLSIALKNGNKNAFMYFTPHPNCEITY